MIPHNWFKIKCILWVSEYVCKVLSSFSVEEEEEEEEDEEEDKDEQEEALNSPLSRLLFNKFSEFIMIRRQFMYLWQKSLHKSWTLLSSSKWILKTWIDLIICNDVKQRLRYGHKHINLTKKSTSMFSLSSDLPMLCWWNRNSLTSELNVFLRPFSLFQDKVLVACSHFSRRRTE